MEKTESVSDSVSTKIGGTRILISAYACNPSSSDRLHPGEDYTGWMLCQQLSRFFEVWVITHLYNQEGINRALGTIGSKDITFHFVDLPRWLWPLYKIEFSQRIYYYLWQIKA